RPAGACERGRARAGPATGAATWIGGHRRAVTVSRTVTGDLGPAGFSPTPYRGGTRDDPDRGTDWRGKPNADQPQAGHRGGRVRARVERVRVGRWQQADRQDRI